MAPAADVERTFAELLGGYGTATVTPDPAAGDLLRIGVGPGGILQVAEMAHSSAGIPSNSGRPACPCWAGQCPPDMRGTITSKLTIRRELSGLPLY